MTRLVRCLLPAIVLLLAGAAPYEEQLGASRCQVLSPQQGASLGPDWLILAPYAQRCPVHGPGGRLTLNVDTVRIDRALEADHFHHMPYDVPRSILRDAAGREVGALPEAFPEESPGLLRVRFTDWRRGFPHEIRLYQGGDSALAAHPLPSLRWDPTIGRYQ